MVLPTFSIQWHLTTKCEQRCKHCYVLNSEDTESEIKGEKLITPDKILAIADNFIKSCKMLNARPRVSLAGGNPLLHSYFWPLLSNLQENNVNVVILGNPFNITDDVVKRLVNHGVKRFQFSLDGLKDTHDRMRKTGSFEETTNAIATLLRGGIDPIVMSTVSKVNAQEIPDLIKHTVNIGVKFYAFSRYCPVKNDKENMFSPVEYREFLSVMWKVFLKHKNSGVNFTLKDHLWTLFLEENGLFEVKNTRGVTVSGCGIGISHLSVLADGTVYACRRFKSIVGKVPEESFYDIFNGEKLNEYRNIELLEKCKDCNLLHYCRGCMAVTHGYTGDWKKADPQCWK